MDIDDLKRRWRDARRGPYGPIRRARILLALAHASDARTRGVSPQAILAGPDSLQGRLTVERAVRVVLAAKAAARSASP